MSRRAQPLRKSRRLRTGGSRFSTFNLIGEWYGSAGPNIALRPNVDLERGRVRVVGFATELGHDLVASDGESRPGSPTCTAT